MVFLFSRLRALFHLGSSRRNLIVGFKRGYPVVILDPKTKRPVSGGFLPHVMGMFYRTVAAARCLAANPPSPHEFQSCACGFYALRSRRRISGWDFSGAWIAGRLGKTEESASFRFSALLNVSLFGDVTEGTLGFRATHQKVSKVELSGTCSQCMAAAKTVTLTPMTSTVWFTLPDAVSREDLRLLDQRCLEHSEKDALNLKDLSELFDSQIVFGPRTLTDCPYPAGGLKKRALLLTSSFMTFFIITQASLLSVTFAHQSSLWLVLIAAGIFVMMDTLMIRIFSEVTYRADWVITLVMFGVFTLLTVGVFAVTYG